MAIAVIGMWERSKMSPISPSFILPDGLVKFENLSDFPNAISLYGEMFHRKLIIGFGESYPEKAFVKMKKELIRNEAWRAMQLANYTH